MQALQSLQLQGQLGFLSLAEVFNIIASSRKTGILTLRFETQTLTLAFLQGRLGGINGDGVPRISDALLSLGIPAERVGLLGQGLAKGTSPVRLETQFSGAIEQLSAALCLRLEVALMPQWNNPNGLFEFAPKTSLLGLVEPGLSLDRVLLDITRRLDELGAVPYSPQQIFMIAERMGDLSHRLKLLMPSEWRVLSLLNGGQTLAQLSTAALMPWDELLQSVAYLERYGFIEPLEGHRAQQSYYEKLEVGDVAPAFSLPALDGSIFSLGSMRGKRTLLTFFRHGGCPWCNLQVHRLIQAYPELQAAGIEVVAVFGSSLESLRERVGSQKPPFAVLADPDDAIHELYATQRSLLGLLDPRAMPAWLEGYKLGIPHGSTDGETTRMPADFFINGGLQIEQVLYARNAAEHFSLEQLLTWVK